MRSTPTNFLVEAVVISLYMVWRFVNRRLVGKIVNRYLLNLRTRPLNHIRLLFKITIVHQSLDCVESSYICICYIHIRISSGHYIRVCIGTLYTIYIFILCSFTKVSLIVNFLFRKPWLLFYAILEILKLYCKKGLSVETTHLFMR